MTKMKKGLVTLVCALLGVCAVGFASCNKKKECDHKWGDYETTQEATCGEAGEKERICSACGEKETDTIAPTGEHSYGSYKVTKEPTCTKEGKETATCYNCDDEKSRSIDALGHDFKEYKLEPTCSEGGYYYKECETCKERTVDVVYEKLGHDWQLDGNLDYCARICKDSGERDAEGNIIYEKLYACSDVEFSVDGTKVVGIGNCDCANVYIPSVNPNTGAAIVEIGSAFTGYSTIERIEIINNITTIADGACSSCVNLKEVVLPECVTTLGDIDNEEAKGVFANCGSLEKVTLAEVQTIGDRSFAGCTSLTEVVIPATVTTIGNEAFKDCHSLAKVTIENNTAISSLGDYSFYGCGALEEVNLGEGITSLGEYAFSNCASLKAIEIPATVEKIGAYAFSDCGSLATVKVREYNTSAALETIGAYAFSYGGAMVTLEMPLNVTTVGEGAFEGAFLNGVVEAAKAGKKDVVLKVIIANEDSWSKIDFETASANPLFNDVDIKLYIYDATEEVYKDITKVVISDSATKIGSYAFAGYDALTEVTIGESVTSIGEGAFVDCVKLAKVSYNAIKAECVGENTFVKAGDVEKGLELTVGANVEIIPANLFNASICDDASYLTKVSFATGSVCTKIDEYAFNNSIYLVSVDMGDSVETIEARAFYGCADLATLAISGTVTSIGDKAFSGCASLETVVMPATAIPHVSQETLKNVTILNGEIKAYAFKNCDSLETLTIGGGVTAVEAYAFANCGALKTLTVEDGAAFDMGAYAFTDCGNLTKVVIGNDVTSIGAYAFFNAKSLTEVVIGDAVESIGASAFKNCSSLETVTLGKAVEVIEARVFENCDALSSVDFQNRFNWKIADKSYTTEMPYEWTTGLAEKSTAAEYLSKTYMDYEWTYTA